MIRRHLVGSHPMAPPGMVLDQYLYFREGQKVASYVKVLDPLLGRRREEVFFDDTEKLVLLTGGLKEADRLVEAHFEGEKIVEGESLPYPKAEF